MSLQEVVLGKIARHVTLTRVKALVVLATPIVYLFFKYWSMASIDNGYLVLEGDVTSILMKTCDIALTGNPLKLLAAHADHVIAPLYLISGALLIGFGDAYAAYAATLLILIGLAIGGVALVVFRVTGHLFVSIAVGVALASGSWLSRGAVTNYSEISYALTMVFTSFALVLLYERLHNGPSLRNAAAIAALCVLSATSVATGVVAFIAVGSVWGLSEAYRFATDREGTLVARVLKRDWRLAAALAAAAVTVVALYAAGIAFLGNPAPGTSSFGQAPVEASTLMRTWTTFRMGWMNLFLPFRSGDGNPGGTLYLLGERVSYGWGIVLATLAPVLAAAGHSAWRDWRRDRATPIAAAFIVGLLLTGVLICVMSVLGRSDLALTATRYVFTQALVLAMAVGVACGYWATVLARMGRAVAELPALAGALFVFAIVLNQEDRWRGDIDDEALAIRDYLRIENRGPQDWWTTCPLVLDKAPTPS